MIERGEAGEGGKEGKEEEGEEEMGIEEGEANSSKIRPKLKYMAEGHKTGIWATGVSLTCFSLLPQGLCKERGGEAGLGEPLLGTSKAAFGGFLTSFRLLSPGPHLLVGLGTVLPQRHDKFARASCNSVL
jgi:hypothetical protein